ncbi:MAG: HD domain-containing protein [Nitrospirae bacterium]|nr:HD domain-containing protein [Nitrospirota bacterium]
MIIKTKIITIIALTIIITVGITTAIVLRMQNAKMLESKIADTVFLGDIIERTIAHDMKLGSTQEVQKILENIGKNREVVHIRILSPAGTILKSTNISEIGSKSPDYLKIATYERQQKPEIQSNNTIDYFRNIENRKECFGCHNSRELINGIIQIKLDVSRSFSTMLSVKRMLVFSNIIIVLVISVVLSLLFSRFVMSPLKNLLTAIQEVEAGNWNATVQGTSNDELGTIGTAFNRMIDEMNKLYKKNLSKERELSKIKMDLEHKNKVEDLNSQLEFRLKELETANRAITSLSKEVKGKNRELVIVVERLKKMNEVGRILTSIVETEEVMKIITRTTADLFNTDRTILHIQGTNRPPLIIQYRRGLGTESIVDVPLEYQAYYAEIIAQGKPILLQQGSTPSSKIGVPLKMKGEIIGTLILEMQREGSAFTDEDMEILTTLSNQAIVSMENAWLYESVKRNYFATIQSLVNALEASDLYTKGHSERVKLLALELGRYIGLDFKELEILEHASILHDIGKIGIESFILQKQGKLTSKEYSLIKSHPLIGEEILGPIDTLEGVRQTIIQHHERYDGAGYPYGLRGEELLLKARILSVVDTFDAMMSERPYRKALSLFQVKEELFLNAGKQFDPYVVESFIELINLRGEALLGASGYARIHTIS